MKKLKALGMVSLGCGMLFLTGCGGSGHTLKCEMTEDAEQISLEIKFNSDKTKVEKVNMEMNVTAPEDATSEEMEQAKELFETSCNGSSFDSCKVKVKGNKVTMSVSGSADALDIGSGTLDEVKTSLESEGFTCK